MNAIAEIRDIEARLYRFSQTASEADRLIHEYLGDLLLQGYVTEEDHESAVDELKTDLETKTEDSTTYHKALEDIRDILRDFPGKKHTLAQVVTFITSAILEADTDIMLDEDPILDAIEALEIVAPSPSETLSEIQTASPTPSASRLPLPDTNPEPHTPNENDQQTNQVPAPRRLPGIVSGQSRAA